MLSRKSVSIMCFQCSQCLVEGYLRNIKYTSDLVLIVLRIKKLFSSGVVPYQIDTFLNFVMTLVVSAIRILVRVCSRVTSPVSDKL